MSIIILFLVVLSGTLAQHAPNTADNKQAIVHLFEWRWADIAAECERFLGPYGFGGVQVSPPNENRVVSNRPWWERYQPISYHLNTRSGNDEDFKDMVHRCNQQGVRIYADVVINHMCGAGGSGHGTAGSHFNADSLDFPGVPFGPNDFNDCGTCGTSDCNIHNYGDANQVRNCRLVALLDLKLSSDYVRGKIADYLNYMISIGVAGFRVDAAKHMWPGDMAAIFGRLSDLNTAYFPSGSRPFIAMEVIDLGGEAISASEYTHMGRITEFKYSAQIGSVFRKQNGQKLSHLGNFGEGWGMLSDNNAMVFVDNHDNQRGHGAGGSSILTFRDSRLYKMANAFMLAFPYGFVRMMSSFYFDNTDQGPPADGSGNIMGVSINNMGTCDNGWMCEHRWRQNRNMVRFRNVAAGHGMFNWWDNGNNQIAFSRGDRAFIAINNEDWSALDATLQTGLSSGDYCDVISGDLSNGGCTGKTITVGGDGRAHIYIAGDDEDPMIAIHADSKVGSGNGIDPGVVDPVHPTHTHPTHPTQVSPTGTERTIVFIKKQTSVGQDLFLRGGIGHEVRPGCTSDAVSSQCAIPISHRIGGTNTNLNSWKQGDNHLDWYGVESGQGYGAQGSPLAWTTSNPNNAATVSSQGYGYTPLNQWGDHYWMLDVDMDCSRTENGWFEVKAIVGYSGGGVQWESDRNQGTCGGTAGGTKPYSSGNHFARCGKINVFDFDGNTCTIDEF
ncbi:pancreatic alpha-amylase-like [Branchiostoma floridae]|uniref:Alpha-amylase n=2 Tax=Branchiostoma floridae TaxID=7739 RepID=A0A9J7HEQ2_BRAFL|nr:pancreatic alpha-amylase-like [Branchiostoma floridae]